MSATAAATALARGTGLLRRAAMPGIGPVISTGPSFPLAAGDRKHHDHFGFRKIDKPESKLRKTKKTSQKRKKD